MHRFKDSFLTKNCTIDYSYGIRNRTHVGVLANEAIGYSTQFSFAYGPLKFKSDSIPRMTVRARFSAYKLLRTTYDLSKQLAILAAVSTFDIPVSQDH
ncbi:hypothetical protein NP233_g2818 [Leucocoprinus birnbaumii]|uniref:Uncharacterized protein n=1 Tax=Leucocoprinus birnbaumii TaxID=56174 RepID=A0AAD5VZH3_9AGAR|nr:hypothetical protein NP233_g2818 [Leucocoprinus birnbaumii]